MNGKSDKAANEVPPLQRRPTSPIELQLLTRTEECNLLRLSHGWDEPPPWDPGSSIPAWPGYPNFPRPIWQFTDALDWNDSERRWVRLRVDDSVAWSVVDVLTSSAHVKLGLARAAVGRLGSTVGVPATSAEQATPGGGPVPVIARSVLETLGLLVAETDQLYRDGSLRPSVLETAIAVGRAIRPHVTHLPSLVARTLALTCPWFRPLPEQARAFVSEPFGNELRSSEFAFVAAAIDDPRHSPTSFPVPEDRCLPAELMARRVREVNAVVESDETADASRRWALRLTGRHGPGFVLARFRRRWDAELVARGLRLATSLYELE